MGRGQQKNVPGGKGLGKNNLMADRQEPEKDKGSAKVPFTRKEHQQLGRNGGSRTSKRNATSRLKMSDGVRPRKT